MGGAIQSKLLMVGLSGAGKTNLLTFLEEGPNNANPAPSSSFDTKEVKFKNVIFTVYDVAGGDKVRELWKHYYSGTHALIWVVDSVDSEKFQESRDLLATTLKDPEMQRDIPVLVVATKSDIEASKSVEEVTEALKLSENLKGRPWKIIKTDSHKGEGVHDGFTWLSNEIKAITKKKKGK